MEAVKNSVSEMLDDMEEDQGVQKYTIAGNSL